jgi:hypothetical protein
VTSMDIYSKIPASDCWLCSGNLSSIVSDKLDDSCFGSSLLMASGRLMSPIANGKLESGYISRISMA